MKLSEFVKQNKEEIDAVIKQIVPNVKLTSAERQQWVMNHEGLYEWAKREKVRV